MIISTDFIEPCCQYANAKGIKLYTSYDVLNCQFHVLLNKNGLAIRLHFDWFATEGDVIEKIREACDILNDISKETKR